MIPETFLFVKSKFGRFLRAFFVDRRMNGVLEGVNFLNSVAAQKQGGVEKRG